MNIIIPNLRRNGTLTKGNNPNKIILHHPVFNGTPEALNEMEINNIADPMIMSGYNFYVRKDGPVYAMRPVWAIGANCYGQNAQSIGVAAEGDFMVDTMSSVQKHAIIDLCKYLKTQYPGIVEVAPHKKYYNTDCPGINYPLDEILNRILNSEIMSKASVNSEKSIQLLQHNLNRLFNIGLSEDNILGSNTKAAINKYGPILGSFDTHLLLKLTTEVLGFPVLQRGSTGPAVGYIQYRLKALVDRIFGEITSSMVEAWQKSKGLTTDGIVGPITWSELMK